jgi:hypothetical protein
VNLDVHNHLWAWDGDEADVNKGQVAEEDICGNESELRAKMMSKFLSSVIRCMDRKSTGNMLGSLDSLSHPEEEIFIYMFDFVFLHCMATFEKHYLLKINKYAYTLYIHFESSYLQVK